MIQWHFERIGTVLNKSENAGIVLNTVEKILLAIVHIIIKIIVLMVFIIMKIIK